MTAGRPTLYTEELANKICELITEGKSLKSIVEQEADCPDKSTIFSWLSKYKQFADNYARATEQRTESQLEMLNELGDTALTEAKQADNKIANAVVQAVKLKADNLKWVMARMKPKKYGDKIDMTTDGKALTVELISYKKELPVIPAVVVDPTDTSSNK